MCLLTVTQTIHILKMILGYLKKNPYLRKIYIEANIEEDIDLKNQFRIKKSPDSISIGEAASKKYVDNKLHDPSIIKKHRSC